MDESMKEIAGKETTPEQKIAFYKKEVEEGEKQIEKGYQDLKQALQRKTKGLGGMEAYVEKIGEAREEIRLGKQKILWAKREQRKVRLETC